MDIWDGLSESREIDSKRAPDGCDYGKCIYEIQKTQTETTLKIPYTGATTSIDINGQGISNIGSLDVDTINIDGNIISDSTGTISFDDDNITTTGLITTGTLKSGTSVDYSEFESDGNLRFNGDATVWDDVRIVPGAFSFPGTADPTLEDWQPGGSGTTFKVYKFKKNDEVIASCQLPHDYKEGSDIYFHIHWTPGDRGNEESGNYVGWKIDYVWQNIRGVFGSSATVDLSDACTGTDDLHEMTPDVLVTGTGKTISSILFLRIYRSDTGTDDTWVGTIGAQSPALLEFDIHYKIDTVGSNERLSK